MRLADSFNQSNFSRWLNSPNGRIFRISAGAFFLIVGILLHSKVVGIAAIVWSFFPLTAGGFDVCYISAALGGPFSGKKIRKQQAQS